MAICALQSPGGWIDPVVQQLVGVGHYPSVFRIGWVVHVNQSALDGFNDISGAF